MSSALQSLSGWREPTVPSCGTTQRPRKGRTGAQDSAVKMPLISKRMNPVEKYISEFDCKQEFSRAVKGDRRQHSKELTGSTERGELATHYRSVDMHDFVEGQTGRQEGQTGKGEGKYNCVKYASIADRSSEERIERLSKLEKDYSLLKQRLSPHQKQQSSGMFSIRKPAYLTQDPLQNITEQDIQRELKNTVVREEGKSYFADLYLLKKGRDNIMTSLLNAGKLSLSGTKSQAETGRQPSYEEKVRASEKEFVSRKILKDREVKKAKMMKGRSQHWNVYYDMLALSNTERQKLKRLCKLNSTFGIS